MIQSKIVKILQIDPFQARCDRPAIGSGAHLGQGDGIPEMSKSKVSPMFKSLLLAGGAAVLLAGATQAADLPRRAAPPPVFTPVPVFT